MERIAHNMVLKYYHKYDIIISIQNDRFRKCLYFISVKLRAEIKFISDRRQTQKKCSKIEYKEDFE